MFTNKKFQRVLSTIVSLVFLFSLFSPAVGAAPATPVSFTILHTNDFHGQLEPSGSNPGMARVATYVNSVRTALGDGNVLMVDAGDEMQGSLLSNIQKGAPVIATFNAVGYDAATFGNHEFDWGQTVLGSRTGEATYPYVTANIVKKDGADCATSGWTAPDFAAGPYEIIDVGDPVSLKVAFIGVTTAETPIITIASATDGLCFKDAAESISHYYSAMKADGADVIVVLSHLGYPDGGYGYGIPVYGDQTLAQKLIDAGTPANLIIGGHSHTNLSAATIVGSTVIGQAYYNGRRVGRADVTVGTDGSVAINWLSQAIATSDVQDPTILALIATYSEDPAYQALINTPIGYAQVDLLRNYNGDSMMGDFVDDAIYGYLNNDAETANDVDMFFNNAGGIRTDWCDIEDPANPGTYIWSSNAADCNGEGVWTHDPMLLTYGNMFNILPFGNATIVGEMTGAQILELLNQSATLFKGAIQPAGIRYSFYRYSDANPGPQPYGWGAYDVEVYDKATTAWVPLDLARTYMVGTNEFLAPAGQDGYIPFKYMTNITYWGDMLDAVNGYVTDNYTMAAPYKGPDGDGTLDGRITRDGNGDDVYEAGEIVPMTILHHNDSHGNLAKGTYVGFTQLATLIKQERLHNPDRTLLFNAGDSIQGDAMMYYFKDAGAGFATDGTVLPPTLQINPFIAVMNSLNYTAMTLGNHEFNFGSKVFVDVFTQANFPILGANLTDDGSYGINKVSAADLGGKPVVNVRDSLSLSMPSGTADPIKVGVLGITNHRVPNYELPSNIPGLTFSDPIVKAAELVPGLRAANDVVLALTHIGFTENPKSLEVDKNVDTNLAATVGGIDAIIGSHSHTDPSKQTDYSGAYKYLPAIVAGPDGKADLVTQAYRYNNYLGEVMIGLRSNGSGGFDVVSQTGRYIAVTLAETEDPATKAIVDPYAAVLATYNNKVIGETTAPIDALQAFTQETNGANLQRHPGSSLQLEDRGYVHRHAL
jgi:5'-nucleotidase/UDP-sugar diphosphatase